MLIEAKSSASDPMSCRTKLNHVLTEPKQNLSRTHPPKHGYFACLDLTIGINPADMAEILLKRE